MVSPVELAKESLPLVLQVVLVLWDHYTPLVQDQAREMLVHLIHELVISKIEDGSTSTDKRAIEDLADSIRRHDTKVVWAYDDNNGKEEDGNGIRVPEAMQRLATQVVQAFSITYPSIREDWSRMTLSWATSCPVRHLACRSFQLFRCIQISLDEQMLSDMLARLSNTIADDETDILSFSLEILTTLKTVIASLTPDEVLHYPQLFWTACACLDTIHEREFMETLAILDNLLNILDLSHPGVIKLLREKYPAKWEGTFEGLQSLVYKGIRSGVCLERSLKLLERLVVIPSSEVIGDDNRLLFTTLANFPRFLRSFEQEQPDQAVYRMADTLAKVAESQQREEIALALHGFASRRFRSGKDFLAQTLSAIRGAFFPDLEFKALTFLMGCLTNNLAWFKIETMRLLCVIIPDIDMRKPDVASQGPDLISPLLRLLQTEFCPQALEVLDNVMTMTGTPMDKHHLRMSMAGSHSSRAFRKEYARTQCLYGIPEESGWSIPMPAVYSGMTRNNVHAVFYTCAANKASEETIASTPDIEFHTEDDPYGSYFPEYRSQTMMSDDPRDVGNMGDLVMKLDSLDDFFEDDTPALTRTNSSSNTLVSRLCPNSLETRETVYDQQTFPILHKSLSHNPSVSSFQTGFADMKVPLSREPSIMTPTAFTNPSAAGHPIGQLSRPGIHSRSITAPDTGPQLRPTPSFDVQSGDEADEPFSDDELSPRQVQPGPHFLDSMIRPITQGTRSGLRSGMRRLTGGNDAKERERVREALRIHMDKSPKVPKVPEMYLQQNTASQGDQ